MLSNCIKNLLNLKDLHIKSIRNLENSVEVYAELPTSKQVCPCCKTSTTEIHDHYTQPVKDIPIQFKPTTIFLKKTRYECKNCGKSFYPNNYFVAEYKRKSKRLVSYIVNQLKNNIAASTIAKNINIDSGFIFKMLPYLSVTNTTLPRVRLSNKTALWFFKVPLLQYQVFHQLPLSYFPPLLFVLHFYFIHLFYFCQHVFF